VRWYFISPLVVSLAALVATLIERDFAPSPELLRTMAGLGVSFFLAYVIEATWLVRKVNLDSDGKSAVLLEVITGIAVCGLGAVGALLALSEHSENQPYLWVDIYFFWWSLLALSFLGILVAVQPALAHELDRSTEQGKHPDVKADEVSD